MQEGSLRFVSKIYFPVFKWVRIMECDLQWPFIASFFTHVAKDVFPQDVLSKPVIIFGKAVSASNWRMDPDLWSQIDIVCLQNM